jgi:hypothetical protein
MNTAMIQDMRMSKERTQPMATEERLAALEQATRAANYGTSLERLKQAGGWSNIQTPLRYIKASAIANEGVILE